MKTFCLIVATLVAPAVFAAPKNSQSEGDHFPEVIPGDGLPSLKSLNLSSADLYDPNHGARFGFDDSDDAVDNAAEAAAGAGHCRTYFTRTPVSGARACRNYLAHVVGWKKCSLHKGKDGLWEATFCSSGDAVIVGGNPAHGAASDCRDVAFGVQWVINHCTHDGKVRGQQAAAGNGNLIVGVTGKRR